MRWALYGRRRRFYAEHLVFAFYIFAFVMLWMGIITLALTRPVLFGLRHGWSDGVIETTASTIVRSAVRDLSVRGGLGGCMPNHARRTAVKTLLLAGWTIAVVTAYRFVLFFTSFYAT